jgi:glutamyl-tRNA reductase
MDVARHLFEVAAGLDSQMVGENQILAQVKAAYTESLESHMSKLIFHRMFHHAFRAGKAVRTQTDINCGAVSIGLAAVELARDKVNLRHARALVIGAGENAELVVRYLTKAGLANLVIANRDVEKARAMARRFGTAKGIGLPEIGGQLRDVDLIVASTAATEPVLTYDNAAWHLSRPDQALADHRHRRAARHRSVDDAIRLRDAVQHRRPQRADLRQPRPRRNREVAQGPRHRRGVRRRVSRNGTISLDLVPVIARLTQAGLDLARSEARRYAGDFGDGNGEKLQRSPSR